MVNQSSCMSQLSFHTTLVSEFRAVRALFCSPKHMSMARGVPGSVHISDLELHKHVHQCPLLTQQIGILYTEREVSCDMLAVLEEMPKLTSLSVQTGVL